MRPRRAGQACKKLLILARIAAQAPDELVCDMAETYHVYDWRALGLPLAATLAAGLRQNSRVWEKLNGQVTDTDTLLLAKMTDALQLLVWAKTIDGQKGRNRPESVTELLLGLTPARQTTGFVDGAAYEAARARILNG